MKLFASKFTPGNLVLFKSRTGVSLGSIEHCCFIEEDKKWVYYLPGFHGALEEIQLTEYPNLKSYTKFEYNE